MAWGKNDKKKDDPYPLKDDELAAGVSFVRKLSYQSDGTPEVTWARIAHAYIQDVTTQGESIHTPTPQLGISKSLTSLQAPVIDLSLQTQPTFGPILHFTTNLNM